MVRLADDLQKGRNFGYFVEHVLGVQLNHAQRRIAYVIDDNMAKDDREWGFRTLLVVAANQIGKTLITGCIILWGIMYKIGNDPDPKTWASSDYLWVHLGPVQGQSYHAYKDIKKLYKNQHDAQQGRGRFPTDLLKEVKIEKYYDGYETFAGAQAMFRTAEDKAEAVLGYRASAISVDEAAFVDHLSEIINTVLRMRLISTGGPLFILSTPNGMNDFFDEVDAVKADPDGAPMEMCWRKGADYLVWATIQDNVGYGYDQAAVDAMEKDLDESTKEQQLRGAFLEPAEAFFVPQQTILDCFKHDLPDEVAPVHGHQYAVFWDPSVSSDPTSCIVLDVTNPELWEGVYHRWYQKPMGITQLINEITAVHNLYNGFVASDGPTAPSTAVTGFDATSMGGSIVKQLLSHLYPKRPVNFGGPSLKLTALTDLRALMTKGTIVLPASWTKVRQEVMNYRLKDDKIRQDNVMALMGASVVAKGLAAGRQQADFDPSTIVYSRPVKKTLRWG